MDQLHNTDCNDLIEPACVIYVLVPVLKLMIFWERYRSEGRHPQQGGDVGLGLEAAGPVGGQVLVQSHP